MLIKDDVLDIEARERFKAPIFEGDAESPLLGFYVLFMVRRAMRGGLI